MESDKRTQFLRLAAGRGGYPIPEFPPPPQGLYRPDQLRAVNHWINTINEWRKNIPVSSTSVVRSQRLSEVQRTTGAGVGEETQPAPPFNEQDLKSLYLFEWVMS